MRFRKILSILGVALILSLLSVPIVAEPALAQSASASPTSGKPGDILLISGWGFTSSGTIQFYYPDQSTTVKTFVANSAGDFYSVQWTIPATGPGGSRTLWVKDVTAATFHSVSFTISATITLNSTSGRVGDTITFDGTGFAASNTVTIYFDGTEIGTATTDANGALNDAPFTVPSSAQGSHTVKVQTSTANYATANFTTNHKLTSISATSGSVGDSVTVNGSGFKASTDITVSFGGTEVMTSTSDEKGTFSIDFLVPSVANGTYKVKVSDGTNNDEAEFTLASSFSISPTSGSIGSQIVASGSSFITEGAVTITYDNEVVATIAADTKGNFSVTFEAPSSQHGTHTVTATDGANTMTSNFIMESQAPVIPAPLLPYDGIKAETPVHFDWKDVEDPSGVTYNLQIASDQDFNFLVLEKTGLEKSEYTLTEAEKLESTKEEAPYYWRVQATDGAGNESDWTTAGSFFVGFTFEFSGWIMWVAIGVGAVIVFLIGLLLGKRSSYY